MAFMHKVVASYLALLDDPWLYEKQNLRLALLYLGRGLCLCMHVCMRVRVGEILNYKYWCCKINPKGSN